MRADGLDELKRLLGDLGVEIQAAFVGVFDVVKVTPDRELNVATRDDLAAQNRFAVAADTGCMVSKCHAGDVDFWSVRKLDDTSSLDYRPPASEAVLTAIHRKQITTK